jgi:hypothetical protein
MEEPRGRRPKVQTTLGIPPVSLAEVRWAGHHRALLTFMTFHGIDINGRVELPRTKEPREAEEVARAVRRCAVGAEQTATHPIILTLLILCPFLHLHLLLLSSVHIMDAHQQAIVHDLQLG